eukprot:scaffold2252_cov255-Pinguiococcus_pyrenoidosus.AAC.6
MRHGQHLPGRLLLAVVSAHGALQGGPFRCWRVGPGVDGQPKALQPFQTFCDAARSPEERPSTRRFTVDQARRDAQLGKSEVGVVLPKRQAILGSAGEHAVRLLSAFRDQVIHEHSDVSLVTANVKAASIPGAEAQAHGCGGPCNQPLGAGFFIARGATDLARQVEILALLRLQVAGELPWIHEVILDVVGVAQNLRVLEAPDAVDDLVLPLLGERSAEAIRVHDIGADALGLKPDRMIRAVWEPATPDR